MDASLQALARKPGLHRPTLERSQSLPLRSAPAQQTMLAELGVADGPRLTPDEEAVLRELRFHRPRTPRDIVLFTDPNKDSDDVVTYTIGKQLQDEGFVRLKDVVVTLGDAQVRAQRAQVARGVFDRLELPDVRVSRGQDYAMNAIQVDEHAKFLHEGHSFRAAPADVDTDSPGAMRDRLRDAPHPLSLVVIAGMTDANALITHSRDLVRDRIETITIMGGIDPAKDADGFVQPDTRAYNNTTDMDAARSFYRRAQELGIPMRIVTKEAAYKTAVPPSFYEGIASSGHPVGEYLRNVQRNALEGLWNGIQAGLLPGLDAPWFFRTFVSQEKADSGRLEKQAAIAFDDIWPQVTKLNLYDPLTLLAALPGTARLLFKPQAIQTEGFSLVEHVGHDEVERPEKAKRLMSALAKAALAMKGGAP
ncbi:type III secretion system effector XopQ [Xylophilus ampelinus]